jgi:hypothetical protein
VFLGRTVLKTYSVPGELEIFIIRAKKKFKKIPNRDADSLTRLEPSDRSLFVVPSLGVGVGVGSRRRRFDGRGTRRESRWW